MLRNLDSCFYCQGLKNYQPQKGGKCGFCNVYNNPLYLINYENQKNFFVVVCLMAISEERERKSRGK